MVADRRGISAGWLAWAWLGEVASLVARRGECGGGWRVSGSWQVVAFVAGGQHEVLTVFRRCAAPEKIKIDRTAGNNSSKCLLILQ